MFDDAVRAFFMDFAAKISSGLDVGGREKVYVSRLQRGKDHPNYRRCLNEEHLIAELFELGFYIFEPDLFSLPEQIATFQQARIVVGPSGAGMFNTIFCNPGTIVIAIEPLDYWFWQHRNIYSSSQHRFGFITGGANPDDPDPFQTSWSADIPAVMKRVKSFLREI